MKRRNKWKSVLNPLLFKSNVIFMKLSVTFLNDGLSQR